MKNKALWRRLGFVLLIFLASPGCGEEDGGNPAKDRKKPPSGLAAVPPGGTYCSAVDVTLAASRGRIYYTLDGTEPTVRSFRYQDPIEIGADAVLKFIAVDASGKKSETVTQNYLINLAPASPDYLVISADGLADEAEAIRAYRESQCHHAALITMSEIIAVAGGGGVINAIKSEISSLYQARDTERPFFVLLVGDADLAASNNPELVPAPILTFDGHATYGDNWYADVTGADGVPELAIGRLPFRSGADVTTYLNKVVAYESVYQPGTWNRRISFFAGNPGFGEPIDSLIEAVAVAALDLFSYDYDVNMTYGNEHSAFFYVPAEFSDKVYERINDGALSMVYMGHGNPSGLDDVLGQPILDTADLNLIAPAGRAPILILIACSTGAFQMAADSLSDKVIRGANGIPAVFSATTISYPDMNAIMAIEMARKIFEAKPPTLGEGIMAMKEGVVLALDNPEYDPLFELIMDYEGFTEEEIAEMLLGNAHMYVLFGDPALIMPFPGVPLELTLDAAEHQAGDTITVLGQAPGIDGTAVVTLEVPRPVYAYPIEPLNWADPLVNNVIRANYANANNKVLQSQEAAVTAGSFSATFDLPDDLAEGTYYIKAYAWSADMDMMGSVSFQVIP